MPILYSIEMERSLIGSILIDPANFPAISTWLSSSDFHEHRLAMIWEAFNDLHTHALPIGYQTVCSRLEERDLLGTTGGSAYLTGLLSAPTSSQDAAGYAAKVRELSLRRKKMAAASKMAKEAANFDLPIEPAPAAGRGVRFVVHSAAEALEPRPPLDWVVDQLILPGSLNVFYGPPGAKKTYSMLTLGVCVAAGKAWLGWETRACRTLYIDEESGERSLASRIAAALGGELLGAETSFEYVSLSGLRLDDPAEALLLQDLIKQRGAGLVFLDAFSDVTSGDENSKQDTQPVFNRLRRIAEETGAAIILIHHSNKSGGYRGSSVIKAAVDLMVQVESEDGSQLINFTSEKNRNGEAVKWTARAVWVVDPVQFYLEEAGVRAKQKVLPKSQRYILSYLKEHGASPLPEIMAAHEGCEAGTAKKALYHLESLGLVQRTNPGETGRGKAALFELIGKDDPKKREAYMEGSIFPPP